MSGVRIGLVGKGYQKSQVTYSDIIKFKVLLFVLTVDRVGNMHPNQSKRVQTRSCGWSSLF